MPDLLDSFDTGKPQGAKSARGIISKIDDHAQAVWAILPAFNRKHEFGPMPLATANATVGDSVLVTFDEQGTPWVTSFDGAISDADAVHTGDAAGGDLTGTYPNPTVKSSVALGGVPTAATAAVNTNTTQIATTAFVLAQASSAGDGTPAMDGTAARGSSTHFARADHVHPTDTSRAPLASPTFTGDPQAPTPSTGDNDTSIATTAFVKAQAYATLASPTFTGDPQAPTPSTGDNDTSIATTAFVKAQAYATLASPALTGNPTAPTPSAGDNDTSIATTAFVQSEILTALGSGYRLMQVDIITADTTYNAPTGCDALLIECVGGGGAGGGAAACGAGLQSAAPGGGGGGYAMKMLTTNIGAHVVDVGAGGTAGTAGNNSGNSGADTTFKDSAGTIVCTGKGGTGGQGGGAAAATLGLRAIGGAGGVAGTGDFTVAGASGLSSAVHSTNTPPTAGYGGAAAMGFGQGGNCSASAGNGGGGGVYGGGGGGGKDYDGFNTARQGGGGANGVVRVYAYKKDL